MITRFAKPAVRAVVRTLQKPTTCATCAKVRAGILRTIQPRPQPKR